MRQRLDFPSLNTSNRLLESLKTAVQVDWENVWSKEVQNLQPEFFLSILRMFEECGEELKAAGVLPPPLRVREEEEVRLQRILDQHRPALPAAVAEDDAVTALMALRSITLEDGEGK